MSITFAQPHFRTPLLLQPHLTWDVQSSTFGSSFHYFVYVARKGMRVRPEGCEQFHAQAASSDAQRRLQQTERWRKPGGMLHEHMESEDYLGCIEL